MEHQLYEILRAFLSDFPELAGVDVRENYSNEQITSNMICIIAGTPAPVHLPLKLYKTDVEVVVAIATDQPDYTAKTALIWGTVYDAFMSDRAASRLAPYTPADISMAGVVFQEESILPQIGDDFMIFKLNFNLFFNRR